jgi:hypothetical protein
MASAIRERRLIGEEFVEAYETFKIIMARFAFRDRHWLRLQPPRLCVHYSGDDGRNSDFTSGCGARLSR